jgi:uncharacterized membrane protein YjfL (UPF0719 family)
MFITRVLVSLFEFVTSVFLLGIGIYYTYRVIIRANPDFDMEKEIHKGNAAVGILVSSILMSVALIVQKVLFSVVSMFRMYMTAPLTQGIQLWHIPLIASGHILMSLVLSMFTISVTLRMFGKLLRTEMSGREELIKGNVAVGVLLGTVVLIGAFYVGEGVSSLSKALVPQPSLGRVEIVR